MKEIGYEYVRNGKIPKEQYKQAKQIYNAVSILKKRELELDVLVETINTEDLNLIKYLMSLNSRDCLKDALWIILVSERNFPL